MFSKLFYIISIVAVMGRVNRLHLTDSERTALESGFRSGTGHCFRMRCRVILLKADGRSSKDVGSITGLSHIGVNGRVKRFKQAGISGLATKAGQKRKPKLDRRDKEVLPAAIKSHRQRLSTAKAE